MPGILMSVVSNIIRGFFLKKRLKTHNYRKQIRLTYISYDIIILLCLVLSDETCLS